MRCRCGAAAVDCGIAGAGAAKPGAWDLWEQSDANFPGNPLLGYNGTLNDSSTHVEPRAYLG